MCPSKNNAIAKLFVQEQCPCPANHPRTLPAQCFSFSDKATCHCVYLGRVHLPRRSSNNNAVSNVFIQRRHHCDGLHLVAAPLHQRSSNKRMPMPRYSQNSRGLAEVFIQQRCTRQGVRPATLADALTNVYKRCWAPLTSCNPANSHSRTLLQLAHTHQHTGGNNSTAPPHSRSTNATRAQ